MELFMRISETIRICAGNIRPYLEIGSSHVIAAEELYKTLQNEQFTEAKAMLSEWAKLKPFMGPLGSYPWLQMQLCITVLERFVNLKTHYQKGKYRLSLRMLLYTYLAGDVDGFKYEDTKRLAQLKSQSRKSSLMLMIDGALKDVDQKVCFAKALFWFEAWESATKFSYTFTDVS